MHKLKIILQSKPFLICTCIFIILYIFITTKVIKYNSKIDINETEITGIVLDKKHDGDKISITLKSDELLIINYYCNSLAELEELNNNILIGSTLKVNGNLSTPYNNTIPNTFNYKQYLYNKHIFYTMTATNIEIINNNISIFNKIKNNIIKRVESFNNSSYFYAFILGKSSYIDANTYSNYKENGVTHLFAVSGMHIGFLVAFLTLLLKHLKVKDIISEIIICLFLLFYVFLIGFTASVVRASLLYIALIFNKKLKLNLDSKIVLYLIFLVLLIINPFYIYDLGFEYSFLTCFGLMLFSKKITGNYFVKLFKVSLIASIFSIPITLYNYYEINLLSVFNNVIIVPLVSILLFPLTLITFIFPFLEVILNIGIKILEFINNLLGNFSLNIVVPKINILFIIIYYIIVYIIYKTNLKKLVYLVLIIFLYKLYPYLDFNEYVYFIDVGQGDSTLIITAHQSDVIMFDSGGKIVYSTEVWQEKNNSYSLADNLVLFLKSLGITKLDLFVGTHGDTDHIGYAYDLLSEIPTKKIMLNNNEFNYLETNLLNLGFTSISNSYIGENIKITNLNSDIYDDENDSSLVLYTELNNLNLLIMGDAPKSVELAIIDKYNLNVDLLKVGHHGSNTSSDYTFLKEIMPKYAIISSGRNNSYNHPHQETIASLQSLNITYFNTQDKGTIKFTYKSNKEKINFYLP